VTAQVRPGTQPRRWDKAVDTAAAGPRHGQGVHGRHGVACDTVRGTRAEHRPCNGRSGSGPVAPPSRLRAIGSSEVGPDEQASRAGVSGSAAARSRSASGLVALPWLGKRWPRQRSPWQLCPDPARVRCPSPHVAPFLFSGHAGCAAPGPSHARVRPAYHDGQRAPRARRAGAPTLCETWAGTRSAARAAVIPNSKPQTPQRVERGLRPRWHHPTSIPC